MGRPKKDPNAPVKKKPGRSKTIKPLKLKKVAGRPPKDVDFTLFEQLCAIHCTQSEIASMLRINLDVLITKIEKQYNRNFQDVVNSFQETGKCSLRRSQFSLAKKNAAAMIWCSKHYLKQQDIKTIEGIESVDDIFDNGRNICA